MNGGSTGWATEESLDVDMVAAICPNCHVYLVEANSQSTLDLGKGVDSAVSVLHRSTSPIPTGAARTPATPASTRRTTSTRVSP